MGKGMGKMLFADNSIMISIVFGGQRIRQSAAQGVL
jgi:hypothetical protein